jgi:2-polyprenyl-3-methyl-5-hydroxy-6-metoxy-1,4-benzoquinol methylase
MKTVPFRIFNDIYQNSVRSVFKFWTPQMQKEMAQHCSVWNVGVFDFKNYLECSSIRFYKAYRSIREKGNNQKICDVGGFWGVFSITLKVLGYQVTMTESLQYYSEAFTSLFNFISDSGVTVIDCDLFQPQTNLSTHFDAIIVMAVLEHFPHSLEPFMSNILSMLHPDGKVYIEVPNIAYWPKRMRFVFGHSPLVPLRDIFHSEIPFIGHHHEFTISELRDLAKLSKLYIISEDFYNYSLGNLVSLKMLFNNPIQFFAFLLLKTSRECLAVLCEKVDKE